jgi:hypothetical protein
VLRALEVLSLWLWEIMLEKRPSSPFIPPDPPAAALGFRDGDRGGMAATLFSERNLGKGTGRDRLASSSANFGVEEVNGRTELAGLPTDASFERSVKGDCPKRRLGTVRLMAYC